MNVKEAFEVLMDALQTSLEEAKKTGSEAMLEERLDDVNTALVQAEALKSHLATVKELQENWDAILTGSTRVRKRKRRPSALSPTKPATRRARAPRGTTTPQSAYRLPLLEALVELGGTASAKEVTDLAGEKMKDVLLPKDFEFHQDGRTLRWRNSVQWVRQKMVKEGQLKSDSPGGIWEISDEARAYLRENA